MNYILKNPAKIGCYVQTSNMQAISAVGAKLGADVIVNFQMFNMSTMKPCYVLKVGGKVLANDGTPYGYAWNDGDTALTFAHVSDIDKWDNFAACVCVLKDGAPITNPSYPGEIGGVRGRTCVGTKADGSIVIYCWPDGSSGACRLEDLGRKMLSLGCVNAVAYDGGGSTQMICPDGKVSTSRSIGSFLWFCLSECPYSEPTANIRSGSNGEGAKWAQWHLNKHGAALTVDGIFGQASVAALKAFQSANGLTADGVCGPATRAALKGEKAADADATTRDIAGVDFTTPLTEEKAAELKAAGYEFICRYLVPYNKTNAWKALTKAEAEIASKAGLRILSVYESTASRAKGGASAGAADGATACQVAKEVGMPENGIIYFAVDYDAPNADMRTIADYLRAARQQTGAYEIGVYGSFAVIEAMRDYDFVKGFWQTYAWSGSKRSDALTVYQYKNGQKVAGLSVDLNLSPDMDKAGMWALEIVPEVAKGGRYMMVAQMPDWAKDTVRKLCDRKIMQGGGEAFDKDGYPADLDLSMDMLRQLVWNDRAGLYTNL